MDKNVDAKAKKLEEITKSLYQVSEKQMQNQRALFANEQTEQTFMELNKKCNRLFDRLFYTWRKDKQFANLLNQENTEFFHNKQKIVYDLENRRENLLLEKQQLNDLEDNLYNQKRSLLRAEEKA